MAWKENMYAAIAEMLREDHKLDAVTVTDFEDRTVSSGYCDTCYYESTQCRITYTNSEGEYKVFDYYDSFADLIGALS